MELDCVLYGLFCTIFAPQRTGDYKGKGEHSVTYYHDQHSLGKRNTHLKRITGSIIEATQTSGVIPSLLC
jgi:hypothetical protein